MQLSLVSEMPGLEKKVFLDVFAKAYFDRKLHRYRLKTIDGQLIPADLTIGCTNHVISQFPEGTIYKLDVRLVQKNGRQPYFLTLNHKKVQRAIEFFEYNLQVQTGKMECKTKKTVVFEKKKIHKPHTTPDIDIF